MNVKANALEAIGNTPLIRLSRLEKELGLDFRLYGKLERSNPTGSVKDRAAYMMMKCALEKGVLRKGDLVIEPTSGNTGIGLAMVCAILGCPLHIYMPSSASKERVLMMQAFGAKVFLTPAGEGMEGSVRAANEEHLATPGSFIPSQFDNPDNPKAHLLTTAPEIEADLDGEVDAVVAGIGTGGTITGIAEYFASKGKKVAIIGVEPAASPLLSKGKAGPHKIQGIGANFVPGALKRELLDRVIDVTDEESYAGTRLLAKKEGLLVGISSGAALMGASKLKGFEGKNVVIILPDNGERYLSVEGLYE